MTTVLEQEMEKEHLEGLPSKLRPPGDGKELAGPCRDESTGGTPGPRAGSPSLRLRGFKELGGP